MSEQDIGRRRLLLGSAVGALALTSSRTAQADTTFTNPRFEATGAPTARTMPDRLDDVINVKDWDAKGNGSTDDTAAIRAAIAHARGTGTYPTIGATIYFPPGIYVVREPLDFSSPSNIRLMGAGKFRSILRGNCQGWILTHLGHINKRIIGTGPGTSNKVRLTLAPDPNNAMDSFGTESLRSGHAYQVAGVLGTTEANGSWVIDVIDASHVDLRGTTYQQPWRAGAGQTLSTGTTFSLTQIEHLSVENSRQAADSGALLISYDENQFSINDCAFGGFKAVDIGSTYCEGGSFGVALHNCHITNSPLVGLADASNTRGAYTGMPPGSCGVYLSQGIMTNCRVTLFDIGICISGPGVGVMNCSTERCNAAMIVGARNDTRFGGIWPASGAQIIGYQTERCNTGIMVLNADACLFAGNVITGNIGTADHAPIGNMTWDNGTVTVTTVKPHNLAIGADVPVSIENTLVAWLPGDQTGILAVHVTDATHFTYTGVARNPGAFAGGNWNRGLEYAIRVRSANKCVFAGNDVRLHASGVEGVSQSIDLYWDGNGICSYNTFIGTNAPYGWRMPPAFNRSAWKFINCNQPPSTIRFVDLPGQTASPPNNQPGPYEDWEYVIVDGYWSGDNPRPTTPQFGAIISGGGTHRCKVRWNGTNWTCMGV